MSQVSQKMSKQRRGEVKKEVNMKCCTEDGKSDKNCWMPAMQQKVSPFVYRELHRFGID